MEQERKKKKTNWTENYVNSQICLYHITCTSNFLRKINLWRVKTELRGRLDASSSATGCHHATGLYRVLIVWISLILMVYFGTSEVCVADMSKWLFLKSALNVGYNVLFQKTCILLVRNIGGLWYARPEVEVLSSDSGSNFWMSHYCPFKWQPATLDLTLTRMKFLIFSTISLSL
jgi:hypothetical protein